MADGDPNRPRGLQFSVTDGSGRRAPVVGLARWLAAIAPARARGIVAIAIVSDRRMRRLNQRFAGINRVTDVLAFPVRSPRLAGPALSERFGSPFEGLRANGRKRVEGLRANGTKRVEGDAAVVGDIAIARGVARRQARMAGHTIATELRVLALHGLLHLLGYDHHSDAGTMARLERRLRRKGGLREGLIERSAPA